MKYHKLFCFGIFFIAYHAVAIDTQAIEKKSNSAIEKLYHKLNNMPNLSMPQRIEWISKQFLTTPYYLGALGEGPHARYDQFPQHRTDAFDCDTYVNTVLALVLANNASSFQQCIKKMRYRDGVVSYLNRHHFSGLDWNTQHQKNKILKDITSEIKNKNNQAVFQWARALVDKPSWYQKKEIGTIRLIQSNESTKQSRLLELKEKGAKLKKTIEEVPYLPLNILFPSPEQPNLFLFKQIPQGAIIEIVRPSWNIQKRIGTSLNISHLGFAIWQKNRLYFRQASSDYGQVVETPLIDYLRSALKQPTIQGINIQILVPNKPQAQNCV